jgi:tetratricopeptide (TPR) repeat protein
MSKRKAKKKIITEKPNQSKPLRTKGWLFEQHGLVLLIGLFLILATLTVFWQVGSHEFVNFDDNVYVTENLYVQSGLTLRGLIWAFKTMHAGHWHPLTWLSHMLDCQLYGLNAGGHHLTNLVFHIASTLLLFLVLRQMTGALYRSCFVAALFALHPLRVESVAWVTERKDVLSVFFWMLTMWAYIRYVEQPKLQRYLLALLSFTLGLMSKPTVVTLPFVLLLLDYWPLGRFQLTPSSMNPKSPISKSINPSARRMRILYLVREKIPFFGLCAASIVLTIFAAGRGEAIGTWEDYRLDMRVANALVSYVSYIGKMIWPSHLSIFYPYQEMLPLWKVVGSGLLLIGVSVLVIRFVRKLPYLAVGWFWYLGTLVPVIGLVQVGMQAMADRFTYVPLIGLFITITWSVTDILAGWHYRRIVLSITAGLLLLIFMILAKVQVRHWQNSITLFQHSLNVTADNHLSHTNLGVALALQGKTQEAIDHFRQALRIKPDFLGAHYSLGAALEREGRDQEAMEQYVGVLRIKPDRPEAHHSLGDLFFRQGKTQEAIQHLKEALRIKPDYPNAHNNLGTVLRREGRTQEAIRHFNEALRIEPYYPEAHNNLAGALEDLGKNQEAMEHYVEALRIKPDNAVVHNNLGILLFRQGQIREAIAHFNEALRNKPDYVSAYNNLGNALGRQGKIREAIAQFKKALQIKPDDAEVRFNLGLAYLMVGDKVSALEEYKILKKINLDLADQLYQRISK